MSSTTVPKTGEVLILRTTTAADTSTDGLAIPIPSYLRTNAKKFYGHGVIVCSGASDIGLFPNGVGTNCVYGLHDIGGTITSTAGFGLRFLNGPAAAVNRFWFQFELSNISVNGEKAFTAQCKSYATFPTITDHGRAIGHFDYDTAGVVFSSLNIALDNRAKAVLTGSSVEIFAWV